MGADTTWQEAEASDSDSTCFSIARTDSRSDLYSLGYQGNHDDQLYKGTATAKRPSLDRPSKDRPSLALIETVDLATAPRNRWDVLKHFIFQPLHRMFFLRVPDEEKFKKSST